MIRIRFLATFHLYGPDMEIGPYELQGILSITGKLEEVAGRGVCSVVVDGEVISIKVPFHVPNRKDKALFDERLGQFSKFVNLASDYLFQGTAKRIVIETGKEVKDVGYLLIEFPKLALIEYRS